MGSLLNDLNNLVLLYCILVKLNSDFVVGHCNFASTENVYNWQKESCFCNILLNQINKISQQSLELLLDDSTQQHQVASRLWCILRIGFGRKAILSETTVSRGQHTKNMPNNKQTFTTFYYISCSNIQRSSGQQRNALRTKQ